MTGRCPEQSEALEPSSLEVLSGLEALAKVEGAICGAAVSRDPATAEGLALAGVRSASLGDGRTSAASEILLGEASCVHHVNGATSGDSAGAFVLEAASVQEAVDHALLAHVLSARLGRPGLCHLAPPIARSLGVLELPGRTSVARLLDRREGKPEPRVDARRIVDLAGKAARDVSAALSRTVDLVDLRGHPEPEWVLVASGAEAAEARETTRVLSDSGARVAALTLSLVQPFPERAVRNALAHVRTILVAERGSGRGSLLAQVRAAVAKKSAVHPIEAGPPGRLLEGLATHMSESTAEPKLLAAAEAPLGCRLVVAPAGAWGEETVRQVASTLAHAARLRLAPRTRTHLGATVLVWGADAMEDSERDLLVASHPALLERRGPLALVRPGGSVLVLSDVDSSHELARSLGPETRAWVRERKLRVHWLPRPESDAGDFEEDSDRAASLSLAGAATVLLSGSSNAVDRMSRRLEAEGRSTAARWLRDGAARLRSLEEQDLDPRRHVEEIDFRPAPTAPRMPEPEEDAEKHARWVERVRHFHWTGRGAFNAVSGLPVRPAALESLAATLRSALSHPFVLVRCDDAERPIAARTLRDLLTEGSAAVEAAGRPAAALRDNVGRLASVASRVLSRRPPGMTLRSLIEESARPFASLLALGVEREPELLEDLAELARHLPAATVFDLHADTPPRLYLEVLDASRAPLQRRFAGELETLREQLRDLLELERLSSPDGRAPHALAAALGRSATDYLDAEALSRTLREDRASQPLDPERRSRVEKALRTIDSYLEGRDRLPAVVLLRPPDLPMAQPVEKEIAHPDPLAAAVGMFDGMARRMASVFEAARVARLEAAGQYRPERHDRALAELDWEGLTASELALVPPVVVLTSGQRLRERDQGPLSELLRSSRPVSVIVLDEVGAEDEAEDLSRFHIDLGQLVVAHREAYAVGSTLARPALLVDALLRMSRTLRPAVALMRLPMHAPVPWRPLLAEAALHGRACPDFRYDPDAGPSWADRFLLDGNPDPERPWPVHSIAFLEGEEEQSLDLPFTFADAMAFEPSYLRHLRIVPRVAWDDDQIPLADYLDRFDPEGRQSWVPYVWVVDEQGTLQRAVVTRELAMASLDRLRGWRVLQELAGYENVFADRAAARAREQVLAEADAQRAELERAHADALDRVRAEGARESLERLAAALMSPEGISSTPTPALPSRPAPVPPPPPLGEQTETAPVEPAAEEEEEEIVSLDEPYIDSPLCTTCNECTNLNGRLFRYNADKQAFIADASAGSFEELVRAAELCPARCIHPGKPRAGDSTGTPEMIARAAKFN